MQGATVYQNLLQTVCVELSVKINKIELGLITNLLTYYPNSQIQNNEALEIKVLWKSAQIIKLKCRALFRRMIFWGNLS